MGELAEGGMRVIFLYRKWPSLPLRTRSHQQAWREQLVHDRPSPALDLDEAFWTDAYQSEERVHVERGLFQPPARKLEPAPGRGRVVEAVETEKKRADRRLHAAWPRSSQPDGGVGLEPLTVALARISRRRDP